MTIIAKGFGFLIGVLIVLAAVWIVVAGYVHYGFLGACVGYFLTQICLQGITHMLEGVTK